MIKAELCRYQTYDNSGIKKCYSINRQRLGPNGLSLVRCSLSEVQPRKKFKKGDLLVLVVFGCQRWSQRASGITSKLNYNGVVATKKDRSPLATRLYGGLYLEARHYGYLRLAVLSKNVL